ncbi:MAG TPA: tyrosine-protein phosphatase [Drouetiella sp.]
MSHATRILYTTACAVTAAVCLATRAMSDDALRAETASPDPQIVQQNASSDNIDVADFADKPISAGGTSVVPSHGLTPQAHPQNANADSAKPLTADGGVLATVARQVNNGGVVSPHLLRSAQPTPANFQALKKAGVKTIINLRDGQQDIDYERGIVEKLGMRYVSIPMSSFKPVKQAQVQSFLNIVSDPRFTPALVHCRQGEDRTGTMCAMYRMEKQGWTGPQAYKEMIGYGFHPEFVMLDQAIVDASKSTAEPLPMPSFSDMTVDIKSRIGRFYNSLNTSRWSGFNTNF